MPLRMVRMAKRESWRWGTLDRLEAFERMLSDMQRQSEYEAEQMRKLESEGKKKTATYRQYLGNRLFYKMIFDKYREYGLLEGHLSG